MRCALLGGLHLVLAALVACSSSGSASDGGASDGTVGDTGASNTLKCGVGGLTGIVRIVDGANLQALAGATVTGVGCSTAIADDRGFVQADLTKDQLVKVRFAAVGYITEHAEAIPKNAGFNRTISMYGAGVKSALFSNWPSGSGYIAVAVAGNGTAAGCSPGGLVVSVKNHPEITTGYLTMDDGGVPTRANLTATDPNFSGAVLGPMPAGTYEVAAVAPDGGCAAGPDYGPHFTWPASTDVEPDVVSGVQLKMP